MINQKSETFFGGMQNNTDSEENVWQFLIKVKDTFTLICDSEILSLGIYSRRMKTYGYPDWKFANFYRSFIYNRPKLEPFHTVCGI